MKRFWYCNFRHLTPKRDESGKAKVSSGDLDPRCPIIHSARRVNCRYLQMTNDFISWRRCEKRETTTTIGVCGGGGKMSREQWKAAASQSRRIGIISFSSWITRISLRAACVCAKSRSINARARAYTPKLQRQRTTCTSVFQRKEGWQNGGEIRYSRALLQCDLADNCRQSRMRLVVVV